MSIPVKVGIIGGSGLDNPDILKNRTEKKVSTIFGEPSDNLVIGDIEGVPCVLLARHGRNHSIPPSRVNYRANIWALKEEGCTHVVVSTACGSLKEEIKPGDIVILDNFYDNTKHRQYTFYDGVAGHPEGILHLPIQPAFCEQLRQVIIRSAVKHDIRCHEKGTVVTIEGPRFSTKAESDVYRLLGFDLVGMTIVPEVVLAKEAGLSYAAIAMATDYDCWRSSELSVCVEEVLLNFKKNVNKITKLILATVPAIANEDWVQTIGELQKLVASNTML